MVTRKELQGETAKIKGHLRSTMETNAVEAS